MHKRKIATRIPLNDDGYGSKH